MLADLIPIRFTERGAHAIVKESFCRRRTQARRVAEPYGGRLAGRCVTDDGE